MNKSRLEAFSDGVFAIVITLLILDIHAPSTASLSVHDLRPLLPHIATFVLSFIIVGVYWVAHHHMLHFIRQVDRNLLWLNLLLLLCVVFIPFPASLLGTGFANALVVRLESSSNPGVTPLSLRAEIVGTIGETLDPIRCSALSLGFAKASAPRVKSNASVVS